MSAPGRSDAGAAKPARPPESIARARGSKPRAEKGAARPRPEIRPRPGSLADPPELLRVDMHLHTSASFDCLCDPAAVFRIAHERGLDRVCITDHNRIGAALKLRERYGERIIVGEEVKTAEGVDIIGLWIHEEIPGGTGARETCERIHAQGGIVYMPHPFAPGKKAGGGSILRVIGDRVDAVEGFNARLHDPKRNDRAIAWARARDLPFGAGSDAHTLREVGRAYAEVPPFDDTPASFLDALHRGRIQGRTSSRAVHIASTWAKIRKRLEGR